ncbi:hypothetical protein ACFX13_018252 [Malus domestica]
MEQWVPLFDIFLTSPTPEPEASAWINQSFSASSSSATPITTGSFLLLLMKPLDSIVARDSRSSTSGVLRSGLGEVGEDCFEWKLGA